jgi:aryl-phospho-beta-D-glucosidase BglC (GH1 family)
MVGILKVNGTKIVDAHGKHIILKGAASGGHLNMENFITGYAGRETEHKEALLKVLGQEKFDFFFNKFYEYFWTDEDAKFFSTLGLNCLRVPFNYKHFIDDSEPTKIKQQGFRLLDAVVDSCARHGIYTILDLHTAPGGQSQGWHCDSGIHKALFWQFSQLQDTIINLWKELAKHYKTNEWVAGYNPLNEPADSNGHRLTAFYSKIEQAIRSEDPNHILFLDGNTYSIDFDDFPEKPYPNSVYSIHDYALYGFPGRTERYTGSPEQKDKLKSQYESKIEVMKKLNIPTWNGEFGPVYASHVRGDQDVEETNNARINVLKDQLAIYKTGDPSGDGSPISWSIWLYKDIGYQGLTFVNPDTKWFKVLGPWLKKKQALGLDKWGRDADPEVEKIYEPVVEHFKSVIPQQFQKVLYPHHYNTATYIDLVVRDMLLSQYLTYEFAEYFRGMSFQDLDDMAASFKFENCLKRDLLNHYLSQY